MTQTFSRAKVAWGAGALLLLLLVGAAPLSAATDDKKKEAAAQPDLSGKWQLNRAQSDDPRQKMREAAGRGGGFGGRGKSRAGGFPGRGNSGGDFPGGPASGPGGGEFPGGPPRSDGDEGGRGARSSPRGMEAAAALEIVQGGGELTVKEGADGEDASARTFYTDGRKSEQETPRGRAEVKAKWKGAKLVVEIKPERGGKLTETYELAPSGSQLYVTTKVEDERMPQSVTIRRVYDRGE